VEGETLRPGAAIGERSTRGFDAVELEAAGSRPGHGAAAASPGSRELGAEDGGLNGKQSKMDDEV